ncbi:MAG: TATA-box-binding protein [Promethearchaeota archaeon]|nr:MAG: TATA-box-binding protein [Candidatus Lokiarchaeota archaeon]
MEPDNELDYKINNVVATVNVNIKEKLDLVKIARRISDAEYNPERFPGLVLRDEKPRATFLIFSTGKMVVTGLERVQNAEKAVKRVLKILKKIGLKLPEPDISIQNIVASGDLHTLIDLNKAIIYLDYAMYEPEVFPGLIYRMLEPTAVFLLFSTGKYVCTGVKLEEEIEEAILNLGDIIKDLEITREEYVEEEFEISFI